MRLNPEEIKSLSEFLTKLLADKNMLLKNAVIKDIYSGIYDIIYEDMQREDKLDEEVKDIMERYKTELENGKLEYNKLFNMIKRRLIKERKLII